MELRFRARGESEVWHPQQHSFQTHLKFQSREVGAETPVHARAEAEMPVLPAVEDAPAGVGELLFIAVGGGVVDDHRFAGIERAAAELSLIHI